MSLPNATQSSPERPKSVMGVRFNNEDNPEPFSKDENDARAMTEYLSPTRLRAIAGMDKLENVRTLELLVDTTENSLGNFGIHLPNLRELKLSNSVVASVRDLGTSLKSLNVLWMARCGLQDIDGVSSLPSLKELYLAFNDISDISSLGMLEHLEVLDLESNDIDDIMQVYFLAVCPKLVALTLEGNPVCTRADDPDYDYRAVVRKSLESLKLLDNVPLTEKKKTLSSKSLLQDEWRLISEGIKYRGDLVDQPVGGSPGASPRPATSHGSRTNLENTVSSTLLTETTDTVSEAQDNSSELTHGMNQVICGNPSKALKARRSRVQVDSPLLETFVATNSPIVTRPQATPQTETLYDESENRDQVFAELRRWREDYEHLTQALDDKIKIEGSEKRSLISQSVTSFKPTPPKGPRRRPTPPSSSGGRRIARSHPAVPSSNRPQSAAADFRLRRYRAVAPEVEPLTEDGVGFLHARPPSSEAGGKRRTHVRPATAKPGLTNK